MYFMEKSFYSSYLNEKLNLCYETFFIILLQLDQKVVVSGKPGDASSHTSFLPIPSGAESQRVDNAGWRGTC